MNYESSKAILRWGSTNKDTLEVMDQRSKNPLAFKLPNELSNTCIFYVYCTSKLDYYILDAPVSNNIELIIDHCPRCRFMYGYQWIPNPFWVLPFDLFYCTLCYKNLIKTLLCLKNLRSVFVMLYSLWKRFENGSLNSLWSYVFK